MTPTTEKMTGDDGGGSMRGAFAAARRAWILSDGTKGMEVQSVGLAERMGPDCKIIALDNRAMVSRLAPLALLPFMPLPAILRAALAEETPDCVIATGRRMAGYSILLRRYGAGRIRTIHIQDPKISPRHFDCMIVPAHDKARGENIIVTTGSLNALTGAKITAAAKALPDAIASLPKPLHVFMLGGASRRYHPGADDYRRLGALAAQTAKPHSLAFIPSRRSPGFAADAIREGLAGRERVYIWDGRGENPYPGILARADSIVVTGDSVNMISEACFMQKPVFIHHFGEERGRIARFHRRMEEAGYIRPFESLPEKPSTGKAMPRLDEAGRVAAILMGKARP